MSCVTPFHNNPGCIVKPILQSKELSNVPRDTQPVSKIRFHLPLKLSLPLPPSCKPKCQNEKGKSCLTPFFKA